MAREGARQAAPVPDPTAPFGVSVEQLTAKFGGRADGASTDVIAFVAADLDRRHVDPAVVRDMSAHEVLDLVDVPRAGSFLPYSLSERLTVCARRAHVEPPAEVVPAKPAGTDEPAARSQPAAVIPMDPSTVADVLSGIQAELAALRQVIESLGAELRQRLEAVHEEVLTATGVLDPGPGKSGSISRGATGTSAPEWHRRRAAFITVLLVIAVAVLAGVVLVLYRWDELSWL